MSSVAANSRRPGPLVAALGEDPVADRHQAVLERVAGAALQLGRGVARVRGDGADGRAGLGEPALELEHEQQVGELGLAVGGPALVGAPLPVEVLEVDLAHPVRAGGDLHDAVADVLEQQPGEREVAEVVGADLGLEPVLGAALGDGHHARVVDQDVDRLVPAVGERAHGGEVGEVQLAGLGAVAQRGGDLAAALACCAPRARRARPRGPARSPQRGRCRWSRP